MNAFYRIGNLSHKYRWFHFIDRLSAVMIWTVGSEIASVEDFVFDVTHFSLMDHGLKPFLHHVFARLPEELVQVFANGHLHALHCAGERF